MMMIVGTRRWRRGSSHSAFCSNKKVINSRFLCARVHARFPSRIQEEERMGVLFCSVLLCYGGPLQTEIRSRDSTPSEDRRFALDGFQPFDDDFSLVLLHVTCGRVTKIAFEVITFVKHVWLLATAR